MKLSPTSLKQLVRAGLFGAALLPCLPGLAQEKPVPPAAGAPVAPNATAPQAQKPPQEQPPTYTMEDLLKPGLLPDMTIGKSDAPVTIIEYASLTCPHCAHFHMDTLPKLKSGYIDTGKVRLIFREFPFDLVAMAGAMLARCAPADKYFPLTATLFAKQKDWAFTDSPDENLRKIAYENGFTQESYEACLKKQEIYDGILAERKRAAEKFKVDSTPTLFVNGVVYRGGLSPEQMDAVLKPLLDKK